MKTRNKLSIKDSLTAKKPLMMGILNVTPDSFSDGGKYFQIEAAINHAKYLISEGADIIDVGGESTKPGAVPVSEEEELRRILPVINVIASEAKQSYKEAKTNSKIALELHHRKNKSTLISIDTYKSSVAKAALEAGADIINDVSGLTIDRDMVKVAAEFQCPIVVMHNKGIPATKPEIRKSDFFLPDSIIKEIHDWLKKQIDYAIAGGIKKENIIIDPGIGFGKSPEEDLFIIEHLYEFKSLGFPILIGPSRKSFIKKTLGLGAKNSEEILNSKVIDLAIKHGADILRVH